MPTRIAMMDLVPSEKKDAGCTTTGIRRLILLRHQKVVKLDGWLADALAWVSFVL
jgi:hypothetical protein